MAHISSVNQVFLEDIFIMSGGYVLNFTDATFARFFQIDLNIDINDAKFQMHGTSKANRLRTFLEISDDVTAAKAIAALWEYLNAVPGRTIVTPEVFEQQNARITCLLNLLTPQAELINGVASQPSPVDVIASKPDNFNIVAPNVTAFASYAHVTADYKSKVRTAVTRFRSDGVDCTIDQDEVSPKEGWPRWMERHLSNSRWILVFVSELYKRRADGHEAPGSGLGAIWESGFIRSELYRNGNINDRFIPVGFGQHERRYVPRVLVDFTYFDLENPDDYKRLIAHLHGQNAKPSPLGPPPSILAHVHTIMPSSDDIKANYVNEDLSDSTGLNLLAPFSNGRFALKVRPAVYKRDRLSRRDLTSALSQIRVSVAKRTTVPDEMPFQTVKRAVGFGSGSGMEITVAEPSWGQCEHIRIHQSGQYRLERLFEEDYGSDHMLKSDGFELWNEHFIRRVTLMIRLASRVLEVIGLQDHDFAEVTIRISGLANRKIVPNLNYPGIEDVLILAESFPGTEQTTLKQWVMTRDELQKTYRRLALDVISDVYWNFGLTSDNVHDFISSVQTEFLGQNAP